MDGRQIVAAGHQKDFADPHAAKLSNRGAHECGGDAITPVARKRRQRFDFRAVIGKRGDYVSDYAVTGGAARDQGDQEELGDGGGAVEEDLAREGVAAEGGILNSLDRGQIGGFEGADTGV